jgi:hypothetical protein
MDVAFERPPKSKQQRVGVISFPTTDGELPRLEDNVDIDRNTTLSNIELGILDPGLEDEMEESHHDQLGGTEELKANNGSAIASGGHLGDYFVACSARFSLRQKLAFAALPVLIIVIALVAAQNKDTHATTTSLQSVSCVACNDTAAPIIVTHNEDCATSGHLLTNFCDKDEEWTEQQFCQLSCYTAGNGYGEECCDTVAPPSCMDCTNEPSRNMHDDNKTCAESPDSLLKYCKDHPHWTANKYCQLSCYQIGIGYDGDKCCGAPEPPPSPICDTCTDKKPEKQEADCNKAKHAAGTTCKNNEHWTKKNYCQKSCYDAGFGYGTDVCCDVSGSCQVCTNEPAFSMLKNTQDCDTVGEVFLSHNCDKKEHWIEKKLCQSSCYKAGHGYDGDLCCLAEAPSCQICNDAPSKNMNSTCAKSPHLIKSQCHDNVHWLANKYCQSSCYKAGRGYDGDVCCDLSPSGN